jgi:hypothetical protein
MKTKSFPFTCTAALAAILGVAPGALLEQSDDFSSGNDALWTRQDPIHQAGYPVAQVTFSFPSGAYRIQTLPTPNYAYGQGRGGSLRKDVSYNTNFYVAVDVVSWNDADQQVASVVARIKNPGPGTTCGYLFGYNNYTSALPVLGIYRLTNETYSTLVNWPIHLAATNSYRLAFFGQGTNLQGRLYQLPNTNTPLVALSAGDAIYTNGYSGLAQADESSTHNSPTDITYDNYVATNFCIADQPQSVICVTGYVAALSVQAVGNPPLSYQWLKNGTNLTDTANISGSATATLTVTNVSASDAAPYQVVVTDAASRTATSVVATVTVDLLQHGSPDVALDFSSGAPVNVAASGEPVNTALYGNSPWIDPAFNAIHLTDAGPSESGSFIVGDLDSGEVVRGFDVQFDVLIGGGTASPADGMSFAWATNLPSAGWGETGAGNGLSVCLDIYNNSGEAPAVNVLYGGVTLAHTLFPTTFLPTLPPSSTPTDDNFVPMNIHLRPGGTLDVVYNSQVIYSGLPIPGLANGLAGASFGWGARTGTSYADQWVRNISITTNPKIFGIVGTNGSVVISYTGIMQSATNVNGPYLDVAGAASPFTFALPVSSGQGFWRSHSP